MSGIKPDMVPVQQPSSNPTRAADLDSLVTQYQQMQVPVVRAQGQLSQPTNLDQLVEEYTGSVPQQEMALVPQQPPAEDKFSFQQARATREANEAHYIEMAKGLLKRTDLRPEARKRLEKIVAEAGGYFTNTVLEDRSWLNNMGRGIMDGLAQTGLAVADLGTAMLQLPFEVVDKAIPGDGWVPLRGVREALHETMAESKEFYQPQGKAGLAGQTLGTVVGGWATFGPVNRIAWATIAPTIGRVSPALMQAVEAGLRPGASFAQRAFAEAVASGTVDVAQAADIAANNDLYPDWESKLKALGLTAGLSAAGAVAGATRVKFKDTNKQELTGGLDIEKVQQSIDDITQPKKPTVGEVKEMQAQAVDRVKSRNRKVNSKAAYEWNKLTPEQRAEQYPELSGHNAKTYKELPQSAKNKLKNAWAKDIDAKIENEDAAAALADYKQRASDVIQRMRSQIKDARAERRRYQDLALHSEVVEFLYNRKAYTEARRLNPNFLENKDIVFMDLKALHETNNDLGHAEGDARLNKTGTHMEEAAEAMGLTDERNLFHFGGDEFVAVVPRGKGEEFLARVSDAFGELDNGPGHRKSKLEGTVAHSLKEADAKLKDLKSSRKASEQRQVEGEPTPTEAEPLMIDGAVGAKLEEDLYNPSKLDANGDPELIGKKGDVITDEMAKVIKDSGLEHFKTDKGEVREMRPDELTGRPKKAYKVNEETGQIEKIPERQLDKEEGLRRIVRLERQIREIYADKSKTPRQRAAAINLLIDEQQRIVRNHEFTDAELLEATKDIPMMPEEEITKVNEARAQLREGGGRREGALEQWKNLERQKREILNDKDMADETKRRLLNDILDEQYGLYRSYHFTDEEYKEATQGLPEYDTAEAERAHRDLLHPTGLADIARSDPSQEMRAAAKFLIDLHPDDAERVVRDLIGEFTDNQLRVEDATAEENQNAHANLQKLRHILLGNTGDLEADVAKLNEGMGGYKQKLEALARVYDLEFAFENPIVGRDPVVNDALDDQHAFLMYVRDKYGRDVFHKLAMTGDMNELDPGDAAEYAKIIKRINPENSIEAIDKKLETIQDAVEDIENAIDDLKETHSIDPEIDAEIRGLEQDLDELIEQRRSLERLKNKFQHQAANAEDQLALANLLQSVETISRLQGELIEAIPGSVGEYNIRLNLLREGVVPPGVNKDRLLTQILNNELSGSSDNIKKVVIGRVLRGEDPGNLIVEHAAVKTLVDNGATYRPSSLDEGDAGTAAPRAPTPPEPGSPAATVVRGEPKEPKPAEAAPSDAPAARPEEPPRAEGTPPQEEVTTQPEAVVEPDDAIGKKNARKKAAPKTPKEFTERWKNLSIKEREALIGDAALAGKPLSRLPANMREKVIEELKNRPKTPIELMHELDALEDKLDKQLEKKKISEDEWGQQVAEIGEKRAQLRKILSDDEAKELIGEVDPKDPRLIDQPKYPMLTLSDEQLNQAEAQIKNLSDIHEQSGYLEDLAVARRFKTPVSTMDDVKLRGHKQELMGMLEHASSAEQDLIVDRLAEVNTEIAQRGGRGPIGDMHMGLSTEDVAAKNVLTLAEKEVMDHIAVGVKDKKSISAKSREVLDNPMTTMKDMWARFRQSFERGIAPIEKLDPVAGKHAQMYSGWAVRADQFLFKRPFSFDAEGNRVWLNIRPLADVVYGVGNRIDKLRAFMLAQRELEVPGKTGVNHQTAMKVVENATPEVKAAAGEVTGFINSVLLYAVNAGLVSGKTAKLWLDMHKNYIPLHRIFEGQELVKGGSRNVGARANQAELKGASRVFFRLKKSGRAILDPIQAVVENTRRIIRESDMNRVGLALLKAIREDPDRFIGIAEIKNDERIVLRGHAEETFNTLKKISQERGFDADDETLKQMVAMGQRGRLSKKNDRLIVFEDGKPVILRINPDLADAFSSLTPGDMNILVKMVAAPTQVLKTGIVLQPLFPPLAFMKDAMEGLIRSKYGMSPLGPFRGLGIALSDTKIAKLLGVSESEWLRQYRASGGAHAALSGVEARTNEAAMRYVLRGGRAAPILHPIEALRRYARPFEEAVRIEEYRLAKLRGEDDLSAAVASRNVTIDFNQAGAQMHALNLMVPFLNPAIQSIATDARILREQPGRVALIGTAMALGTWFLMAANDDDKEINDLRKTPYGELFMWFRLPDGTIAKLPKPYFWGQVFMTGAEYAWDKLKHDDPDAAARWRHAAANAAWGIGLPALGQLYMGLKTNETPFGGVPIVPESMQDLLPMYQIQPNTSRVARGIGKALDVSPLRVDFVLSQAFGSLGRDVLNATKLVDAADRMAPEPVEADLPVIGRLFARYPGGNVEPIYTFYQMAGKIESVNNTVKYLEKRDPSKINGVVKNHMTEMVLTKVYSGVRAQFAGMRESIRKIDEMKGATPKEKREMVDALMQAMIEVARQTNEIGRQVKVAIDSNPMPQQ